MTSKVKILISKLLVKDKLIMMLLLGAVFFIALSIHSLRGDDITGVFTNTLIFGFYISLLFKRWSELKHIAFIKKAMKLNKSQITIFTNLHQDSISLIKELRALDSINNKIIDEQTLIIDKYERNKVK